MLLSSNVTTLDPQIADGQAADWVIGSIFEGLCRVDEDGEAVPGVAERWDHSRDYTRFTFHLRKAYWSNGDRVTAEDFRFAIVRALTPETGATAPEDLFLIRGARAFYRGEATEDELGVTVANDRKLVITLEQGYADFPLLTAGNHYMPCQQEFFEQCAGHYGQSAQYVLTNGPFTFSSMYSWSTDYGEREITVVAAEDYRGDRQVLPASVTYLIDYDDAYDTDEFYGLSDGSVDLRSISAEADAQAWKDSGGKLLQISNGVTGILLNAESDNLSYIATRKLFLQTLNRTELLAASNALEREAVGIMPEIVQWNRKRYYTGDETYFANPDEAITETIPSLLSLLERDELPCITLLYPQEEGSADMGPISPENVLSQWNTALGGAFNMKAVTRSALKQSVASGSFDAAVYTLTAEGSTAFHVLNAFASTATPQLLNSESYDAALESTVYTREAFAQLEQQLVDEYVFYPLMNSTQYYAAASGVSGILLTGDGRIDFRGARK